MPTLFFFKSTKVEGAWHSLNPASTKF